MFRNVLMKYYIYFMLILISVSCDSDILSHSNKHSNSHESTSSSTTSIENDTHTTSMNTCQEYGFNHEIVKCSTCHVFQETNSIEMIEIYQKCMSCCISNTIDDIVYEMGVLELDRRYKSSSSDLTTIIKNKNKYGLKVVYKSYVRPTLRMYLKKTDTEPTESIAIFSWNKDTIEDFLKSHLKKQD